MYINITSFIQRLMRSILLYLFYFSFLLVFDFKLKKKVDYNRLCIGHVQFLASLQATHSF